MTFMTMTGKKGHAAKRQTRSKSSTGKVKTKRGINHTKAPSKATSRKTPSRTPRQQNSDATYIFEGARPGCGYRIPREERAEQAPIRLQLNWSPRSCKEERRVRDGERARDVEPA